MYDNLKNNECTSLKAEFINGEKRGNIKYKQFSIY